MRQIHHDRRRAHPLLAPHRRHRHYIQRISRATDKLDLAVRSLRVVIRRSISSIDHAALDTDGAENLARVLDELADSSALLTRAVAEAPGSTAACRPPRSRSQP
ncbi:hypothetical protein [Nesterenkonia pannonica]|uniref:hypothetical protein n=1 Tax=Nesterenkonia pannonica TaxID=1548602 RepID=UPI0021647FE2|nr:hypothetical protein [Nesterenkonia pannonica]